MQGSNLCIFKIISMDKLTPEEKRVIIDKGTEAPFTGAYVNNKATGVYVCRQCGSPLYDSFGNEGFCTLTGVNDDILFSATITTLKDSRCAPLYHSILLKRKKG